MSEEKKKKPIDECYWVVPGKLLAGEFPGDFNDIFASEKIKLLKGAGITEFIDLTEEGEGPLPYFSELEDQSYRRFPIRDGSIPVSPQETKLILDTIDRLITEDRIVYLHCWGGVGRTGLIVGCWLSRHGYKGEKALNRLHELWQQRSTSFVRETPETEEQVQYILNWSE